MATDVGAVAAVTATPSLHPGRRFHRPRLRRIVLGLVVSAVTVGVLLWRFDGYSWFAVATPSMGQAAPVGTLLIVKAIHINQVHVGDIISFRPTGTTHVYTHRVISIDRSGGLHTKGDISGSVDPWTLHADNLLGRVVARWWGVGWLLKALPFLLMCTTVLWTATRFCCSLRYRAAARLFGSSLTVSLAGYIFKPYVGTDVIATNADATTASATVVSTGLLPVRVTARHGSSAKLLDGQVGSVLTHRLDDAGKFSLSSAIQLSWCWWIAIILIGLSPLLWCLIVGLPTVDSRAKRDTTRVASAAWISREVRLRRGYPRPGIFIAVAATIFLPLGLPSVVAPSRSAFSAKIINSKDTAASATWFTCRAAAIGTNAWFVYPLNETSGTTAADVSGNSRSGTYQGTATRVTGTKSCARDTGPAAILNGTSNFVSNSHQQTNPQVLTIEIWFKTTVAGGVLMGFDDTILGQAGNYDRQIYMTSTGRLVFGVYSSTFHIITSPSAYNDGNWHYAAASLSSAGMILYVDGLSVATDASTTSAQAYNGYWRVGWSGISGWPNTPANFFFTGSLAFAADYTTALTATQIAAHYSAGI